LHCVERAKGFERGPLVGGCRGAKAPEKKKIASRNMSHFWAFFEHIVFVDGFLFPVKELGLLTNPGHWVRVLDVVGSYMYIVL
jgi:hypothetical protein